MAEVPSHLESHSFVSKRRKLLYVATPKVACTSLKWWFANIVGVSRQIYEKLGSKESSLDLKVHDLFRIVAPEVADNHAEALAEFFEDTDFFRFALVRNPYSRLFAAWQSKLLLREPLQIGPYRDLDFTHYPVSSKGDIAYTFQLFVEHLYEKEAPSYWDSHWDVQYNHLACDKLNYSLIGKLEFLQEVKDKLRQHLGDNFIDPFQSKPANSNLVPYSNEFLTEKCAKLIRDMYHKDFEYFGYDTTPPQGKPSPTEEQFSTALKAVHKIRGRHARMEEMRTHFEHVLSKREEGLAQSYQKTLELTERKFNEQLNDKSEEYQAILAVKEAQQKSLVQSSKKQASKIEELNREVDYAETKLLKSIDDIGILKKQIDNLQADIRYKDQAIKEIFSSRSWKLTKPQRAITTALRNLKNWTKENKGDDSREKPVSTGNDAKVKDQQNKSCIRQDDNLLAPECFVDEEFYKAVYPDIGEYSAYIHYISHGRKEGRLPFAPQFCTDGDIQSLDQSKANVIVVTHEVSRTGAPILALNIVEQLSKKYNVLVFSLRGGDLYREFEKSSSIFYQKTYTEKANEITSYMLRALLEKINVKFAIVNSIVSKPVLKIFADNFVPSVSLIHEFAAYTFPQTAIREVLNWTNRIIFSANIVYENNLEYCPELAEVRPPILPQGKCRVPVSLKPISLSEKSEGSIQKEGCRLDKAFHGNEVVVLGAGAVQIRKGVDIFLACAAKVCKLCPAVDFKFIWVGDGYDPDKDRVYSVYLEDQMNRAELNGCVEFVPSTDNIEDVYARADIFFLSSRLDPLPNVAIDAMCAGVPVICFDKTTGIADILKANHLEEACVIPYLNVEKAAFKISSLISDQQVRETLSATITKLGQQIFDISKYVNKLENEALSCVKELQTEKDEHTFLLENEAITDSFYNKNESTEESYPQIIKNYLRSWRSGVLLRKPFAGFHPGIYKEMKMPIGATTDPLVDYLRNGRPDGPWAFNLIEPKEEKLTRLDCSLKAVLHIHVYYCDIFNTILERFKEKIRSIDLLISVPSKEIEIGAREVLSQFECRRYDIKIVPNRGRDIAPLLTGFAKEISDRYDIVGHLHTKKSVDLKDKDEGKKWLSFLLDNLIGEQAEMMHTIFEKMETKKNLGLVFPDDPYVIGWTKNKECAKKLASRLGISSLPLPEKHFNFPIGTMFWARTKALAPLFDCGFKGEDFPEEPLSYDGTMLHALERLIPFVVESQGYEIALTHIPGVTR